VTKSGIVPTAKSADQLTAIWAARDEHYTVRTPLTEGEASAVIAQRRREADQLPPKDRVKALAVLSGWTAPEAATS
jgi:hypothetical protein